MIKLGFLASHNGSNMQAIVKACQEGKLHAIPQVVISNNRDSTALKYSHKSGINWRHINNVTHPDLIEQDKEIRDTLLENKVDLVILVGYLKLLGQHTLATFKGRILNTHPSLLPKYGGKGMYGIHVHREVINSKEKETGITIHHVNEEYDQGKIIAQCILPVFAGDTPEKLAQRVLEREHAFIVEILRKIIKENVM